MEEYNLIPIPDYISGVNIGAIAISAASTMVCATMIFVHFFKENRYLNTLLLVYYMLLMICCGAFTWANCFASYVDIQRFFVLKLKQPEQLSVGRISDRLLMQLVAVTHLFLSLLPLFFPKVSFMSTAEIRAENVALKAKIKQLKEENY